MAQSNQFTQIRKVQAVKLAAESRQGELQRERLAHLAAAAQCDASIVEIGRFISLLTEPEVVQSTNSAAMFTKPRSDAPVKVKKRRRAKAKKSALRKVASHVLSAAEVKLAAAPAKAASMKAAAMSAKRSG